MKRAILLFFSATLIASIVFAEESRKLDKITVTPSRLKTSLYESSRSVDILDKDALLDSSWNALPDAIGNIGGIDIRRRGPEGVQADVDIRGTTFEENIVMIDGVKINDPQTGHFSMDLPITAMDVDRVEILKGPASSLYGPNAFGGAINIITKPPEGKKLALFSEGGSFDYVLGGVSATYPLGPLENRFSFIESRSSGYMPETAFNILSLSNITRAKTFLGIYDFLFGYTKKDFGAANFYSNLYPNEEEHTDTRFFKIDGTAETGDLKIMPKIFLRRHRDKFMLDQNRPGWQTNYHTTYNYGGQIDISMENRFMDVACGFELSRDTIDSTNLETHSRTKDGMYVELSPKLADDLYINIGAREDYFSGFGWVCSPSVSASYKLAKDLTLKGSVGKAYRIPTFTDLYYTDAANIGNPALTPENAWTYETGLDYRTGLVSASAVYFHRDSYDTIDWTRMSTKDPWRVKNIGTADTNGVELSFNVTPRNTDKTNPIEKIFLNYTALDTYRKHDFFSKYALDYLKQQVCSGIVYDALGFKNSWVLNYKKRIGDSGYLVVDTKVSKEIIKKGGLRLETFLEITNLFDVDYSEQSDIQMPGRWIKGGARLEF